MVWFRLKRSLGRIVFDKKCDKNGEPHPDYFGGGIYTRTKPPIDNTDELIFAIAHPVAGTKIKSNPTLVTYRTRSLELWKEPGSEEVYVILCTTKDDMKNFANSLGLVDYEIIKKNMPDGRPKDTTSFDVELSLQQNFTPFEIENVDFLELLIQTISTMEYAWIQILFVADERIGNICSQSAALLGKKIKNKTADKPDIQFTGLGSNLVPRFSQSKKSGDKVDRVYWEALKDYTERQNQNLCAISIRGIFANNGRSNFDSINSAISSVRVKKDNLRFQTYAEHPLFDEYMRCRSILDDDAMEMLRSNIKIWNGHKWGKNVDYVGFLCATPTEMADIICHMPHTESLPIDYHRMHIEGLEPKRNGWLLGSKDTLNPEDIEYGRIIKSSQGNVVYDPNDIMQHTYILGASGCGKTTVISNLIKHLEMSKPDDIRFATICFDIKDVDSFDMARQSDPGSDVIFLDMNQTDFGINLLELPEYKYGKRDTLVSYMVDHVISLFKEFYSQSQTFVQMERMLKLMLYLLYENMDSPTLSDMHRLVMEFKKDGAVTRIKRSYKIPTREFVMALESVAAMRDDAWAPILNRIEVFVTDKYVIRHFGVRKTTVKFSKIIRPGVKIFIRISDTDTPEISHRLAIMSLVAKIWFDVKKRAADTLDRKKRIPIVMILDEFQRIGDMKMLTTMLTQGRTYNLALMLSHQNTDQIEKSVLEAIMGNCATKILGRTSGTDATRLGLMSDPYYAEPAKKHLAGLADYTFLVWQKAPKGKEQGSPILMQGLAPPPLLIDQAGLEEMFAESRRKYGIKESSFDGPMDADQILGGADKWKSILGAIMLEKMQMDIVRSIIEKPLSQADIIRDIKPMLREDVAKALKFLLDFDIIKKLTKPNAKQSHPYELTEEGYKAYVNMDYTTIGSSKDTPKIAAKAVEEYYKRGWFVCLANQNVRLGQLRPDLIAYNYEKEESISIEIESKIEVASHREHVLFNMNKFYKMGFDRCHVWSNSHLIEGIRDEMDENKERVDTFVVDIDDVKSDMTDDNDNTNSDVTV